MKYFISCLLGLLFYPGVRLKDVTEEKLPYRELFKSSMDVVSADLDKDGDEDLVVACEFCPNYILINQGNGKFVNESQARLPQKMHDSEDIAVADFDGDGDIDIIFVSEDDLVNEYYINDGKGYFRDASDRIPVGGKSNAVCAVDVDNDNDMDVLIGNDGQDYLLLNDGKGNFTNATETHLPADEDVTQDIKAADLNGDGFVDLFFGNEDEGKVLLNDGKGKFTVSPGALPPVVSTVETRKVELYDIDGDGDLDAFLCNVAFKKGRNKSNLVLLNNGKGIFSDETENRYLGNNSFHSLDAQFIDLDKDGHKDLMIGNGFGGRMQYFLNEKGVFKERTGPDLPAFEGADVITVLHLTGKSGNFIYLGLFKGTDKLLMAE